MVGAIHPNFFIGLALGARESGCGNQQRDFSMNPDHGSEGHALATVEMVSTTLIVDRINGEHTQRCSVPGGLRGGRGERGYNIVKL